jgi:hypothetical protein
LPTAATVTPAGRPRRARHLMLDIIGCAHLFGGESEGAGGRSEALQRAVWRATVETAPARHCGLPVAVAEPPEVQT